jgi:hypothetical protein
MGMMRKIGCILVTLWCARASSNARASSTASLRVPLSVPLAEVQQALEAAVPQRIERLGATEFDNGWGFRYGAWRGPFSVLSRDGKLQIGVRIQVAVRVCRRVSGVFGRSFCQHVASCGFGNDPLAMIDLTTTVGASWSPNWSISPSVSTRSSTIRPCRVTLLNIDVTNRAVGQLRAKIDEAAAKVGNRLQLRARATAMWSRVHPISLGNDRWITWRAEAVRVGPIAFPPGAITSEAAIDLSAHVVTSAGAPPRVDLPGSLIVGASTAPRIASLQLEVAAPWADLDTILQSKFGTYDAGHGIQISLVKLSGSPGRVQLELQTAGVIATKIMASGVVIYDRSVDELSISDIELAAPPSESLAASIALSALEAAVETRLKWQLEPLIADRLRDLGGGLASLAGLRADSVTVTTAGLEARLSAPAPPLTLSP